MVVELDKNGYVSSYAVIGSLDNAIDLPLPDDLEHFEQNFFSYKISDGILVYDDFKKSEAEKAERLKELTALRGKECFQIINRGQLWYDSLTEEQLTELNEWYKSWLDVTETMVAPDKPEWLK